MYLITDILQKQCDYCGGLQLWTQPQLRACVCVCVYLCATAASGRAARALIIHVSGLKLHGRHCHVHSHTDETSRCSQVTQRPETRRHQIQLHWARTAQGRPSVQEMMSNHLTHRADHKLTSCCYSAQNWTKKLYTLTARSQQQPELQNKC